MDNFFVEFLILESGVRYPLKTLNSYYKTYVKKNHI